METMNLYASACIAPLLVIFSLCFISPAAAEERNPFIPRVPQNFIDEFKTMANPIPATAENILEGNMLYKGKGGCYRCHGDTGEGDGVGAMALNPSP
jgi:hypothetical protein